MASSEKSWWVYVLLTESGRLYTGISTDIERRFAEHCDLKSAKGAKFFRTEKPIKIVYREQQPNRSEASKREASIKKLSRRAKCELVGLKYQPVSAC